MGTRVGTSAVGRDPYGRRTTVSWYMEDRSHFSRYYIILFILLIYTCVTKKEQAKLS